MTPKELSALVNSEALALGFDYVGFSKAEKLEEESFRLENWLSAGHHGDMLWMEENFDKRTDPRVLLPGSKSVISLMLNYYPEEKQKFAEPKISKYAYGRDYHKVIKSMMKKLDVQLRAKVGDFVSRSFVDSAPIMDRAWAERAGLGCIGKNANLISRKSGSFFFLAEIVCDLELEYDSPIKDYCGTCTKCLDACPTRAIESPGVINSNKCISYLTIEFKGDLPVSYRKKMEGWAFGCDVCQDVCPWNRLSKSQSKFPAKEQVINNDVKTWLEMDEKSFNETFAGSAIRRTKHSGFKRNLEFLRSAQDLSD